MEALPRPEKAAVMQTTAANIAVIGEHHVCEHAFVNTVQRIASAALDLEHCRVSGRLAMSWVSCLMIYAADWGSQ
jgi:hypothetical protein